MKRQQHCIIAAIVISATGGLAACSSPSSSPSSSSSSPDYPTRPITIITPAAAGGQGDLVARAIAAYAQEKLGQPVTVQDVPGGAGVPGTLQALNAKPDGYTLLDDSASSSDVANTTHLKPPVPLAKHNMIAQVSYVPLFFIVSTKTPYTTLNQVMAFAKENPSEFAWAGGGSGSAIEFAQLQLFKSAGVDVKQTKVSYFTGSAPADEAIASGEEMFGATDAISAQKLQQAGKVRILAANDSARSSFLPAVPSIVELGYAKPIEDIQWQGISGPPGLAPSIIAKWDSVLQAADKDPEFQQKLKSTAGALTSYTPGPVFYKEMVAAYTTLLPLSQEMGLQK